MSDTPENIVLEHLRLLRAGMGQMIGKIDELKADMIEVKERLGFIESQYASLSRRVDRMAGDVELIKRRLELTEA
jgi:predicted nuclease with TOPRIM domain